jgi:hypothetical protein
VRSGCWRMMRSLGSGSARTLSMTAFLRSDSSVPCRPNVSAQRPAQPVR